MFEDLEILNTDENLAKIKIIGVGGAGNNALNRMINEGVQGVEFIAVNCDAQDLKGCLATTKILIGEKVTRGLGAGGRPEIGEMAARESLTLLKEALKNTDMLFITAGMGGGTGTGAAPVIAECAKELGILTVGVVSKPFRFEGKRCMRMAMEGLKRLSEQVDTIIPIPNEALMKVIDKKTTMQEAFIIADNVLCQGVEGVSSLISIPGFMNLDFADIQSVMRGAGTALMGIGGAEGMDAAIQATRMAINNPLLENTIEGAMGIIVNVCGSSELSLSEVNEALSIVEEQVDEEANIFVGTTLDDSLEGKIKVTVIATGFKDKNAEPNETTVAKSVIDKRQPWKPSYTDRKNKSTGENLFTLPPWLQR